MVTGRTLAATIQSTTTVASSTGVNQIQPNFQPTKSAMPSDRAMKRQPRRWSKSFWRKKARLPQNAQRSTPAPPATPAKRAAYGRPHPAQARAPSSPPPAWSRLLMQAEQ
jgi:hypothetical protein